ncbi:MAG: hypothetical protein H7A46_24815 [Verrucomicrobiales bacterium]|nr:hypothetical protein [Verrucomicrobiales bacterium]
MKTQRPSILWTAIGGAVIVALFCGMAFLVVPHFEAMYADRLEGAALPPS